MKQYIISALALNHSGVLTRTTGLFARRGYNIESLTACNTEDERYSRMTITASADEATIKQIICQLDKLVDVLKVELVNVERAATRELMLIKIKAPAALRPEITAACDVYKAKIVDLSPESIIIEVTGDTAKINGFIEVVTPYGIIEMARTGITALTRGKTSIHDLIDINDTM